MPLDNDGNEIVEVKDESKEQIALLTQSVSLIAEGLQKLEGNQSSITAALAQMMDMSKKEVKSELEDEFGKDVDLEQLDNKSLATFIMQNMSKAVKAEIASIREGLDTKVTDLATRFEQKNAGEQINKMAEDHPDFWEWSNEIRDLLKDNPTLNASRAYHIAKSENPKKADELKSKYDKPATKNDKSFIALTPTSSLSTRASGAGKMKPKEAAEAAFDKVMGELGDALDNGDVRLA